MLLNSQIKKIEQIGLKINGSTIINNFEYTIYRNFGRGDHFSLTVKNLTTNEYTTLCTRANIDTVFNKALDHKKANA